MLHPATAEVAYRCSFYSQSHSTAHFTRNVGVSPRALRGEQAHSVHNLDGNLKKPDEILKDRSSKEAYFCLDTNARLRKLVMQNRSHFTKPLHALMEMLMARGRQVSVWLLTALILALALGLGFTTHTVVVQAQDGGTQAGQLLRVRHALNVDTRGQRLCIGQTVSLPIRLGLTTEVPEGASIGRVQVRSATISASAENPDIVQAVIGSASPSASPDAPFPAHVTLSGLSTGSTMVQIDATVQTSTLLNLEDEVALPITHTSQLQAWVPVDVTVCTIRVQMSAVWNTAMRSANVVLITSMPGAVLRLPQAAFRELVPSVRATIIWDATANRIIGCQGHSHLNAPDFVTIVAQPEDNGDVRLVFDFNPRDATTLFTCNRPPPRSGGCSGLPDGECNPHYRPGDTWQIDSLSVTVPVRREPQTVTRPLTLTHSDGSANATATVIVTMEESR